MLLCIESNKTTHVVEEEISQSSVNISAYFYCFTYMMLILIVTICNGFTSCYYLGVDI